MKLGELFIQLGVKADTFTVRDFSKAIGDIPFSVATAITSLAGLSLGFAAMTKEVLDMTSGFQVFTSETGLNTRALQQWQMVAKQAGLSGDIVTSSLTSLSSLMAQMRLGRGIPPAAAQALGLLGFSPRDLALNPAEMLNKIQTGVSGKNPAMATELLKSLGISPEMMRVFQTPASVREGLNPIMSAGDISQMANLQKELATFNQTVMQEFVKALQQVEPFMAALTDVLIDIVHLAGFEAKGYGGLASIYSSAKKQGGLMNFMENIANSYETAENLRNPAYTRNEFNQTNHIYGVDDPHAVPEALDRHAKSHYRKAAADLANRGR